LPYPSYLNLKVSIWLSGEFVRIVINIFATILHKQFSIFACLYLKMKGYYILSKIFKSVTVLFLLMAGITLCAHQLIPHDHHINDPYSNQDTNCPASDSKSDHKSGFPVHCHAFNDLVSERSRHYDISQIFQFNSNALSILTDSDAYNLSVLCIRIFEFPKPIFDSYALNFSLLRAPPALV
jgi:hypothetical protein